MAEILLCKQFHKLIAINLAFTGTCSPGVVGQMSGNQILSNLIERNPWLKIKQTFN